MGFRRDGFSLAPGVGLATLLLGVTSSACAAPTLHCRFEQADMVKDLQFGVTDNPYIVPAVDIGKRFRFKAVMMGDAAHIEYVKLYTYYMSSGQPVLMHEVRYLQPRVEVGSGDPGSSLTGKVFLYSPVLGRELKYECALRGEGT